MSLLAPIYNSVKSISDYFTGSLAKQIADNLDAKVSSRLSADDPRLAQIIALVEYLDAPVSSRASSAFYTPARAALIDLLMPLTGVRVSNLDKLDTTLSAVIEAINNYSPIRSMQTGYAVPATSAGSGEDYCYIDIQIAAVNVQKSIPNIYTYINSGGVIFPAFARLTASTTLRISLQIASASFPVRWQVIEYK